MADWLEGIRVGDVMLSGSGVERVVRRVSYFRGRVRNVTFSIRACSWTKRCYTVITRGDLKHLGYRRTSKRVQLRSALDRRITAAIKRRDAVQLRCCDVVGIARG